MSIRNANGLPSARLANGAENFTCTCAMHWPPMHAFADYEQIHTGKVHCVARGSWEDVPYSSDYDSGLVTLRNSRTLRGFTSL